MKKFAIYIKRQDGKYDWYEDIEASYFDVEGGSICFYVNGEGYLYCYPSRTTIVKVKE